MDEPQRDVLVALSAASRHRHRRRRAARCAGVGNTRPAARPSVHGRGAGGGSRTAAGVDRSNLYRFQVSIFTIATWGYGLADRRAAESAGTQCFPSYINVPILRPAVVGGHSIEHISTRRHADLEHRPAAPDHGPGRIDRLLHHEARLHARISVRRFLRRGKVRRTRHPSQADQCAGPLRRLRGHRLDGAHQRGPEPLFAEPIDEVGPGFVAQVIATGATVRYSAMPEMFESLMYAARRELVVTTPYYVPTSRSRPRSAPAPGAASTPRSSSRRGTTAGSWPPPATATTRSSSTPG